MGLCTSCTSTTVATAKLVLPDGRLQEYSYPVKVSYVLSKNANVFLCDSDEMDFDGVLTAIKEDDELQPGQLYFALPLSRLTRPLQAEEMAALAVKANAALVKSAGGEKIRFFGGSDGGRERRSTKVPSGSSAKVADLRSATVRSVSASGGNWSGRRRMSVGNLGAIPE